jgi:hypothetical protein
MSKQEQSYFRMLKLNPSQWRSPDYLGLRILSVAESVSNAKPTAYTLFYYTV